MSLITDSESLSLSEDFYQDLKDTRYMKSMKTGGKKPTRQNHSEIEKRRRDKMNTYISELATLVPMCSAMSKKLDKLTVLRMAVQHIKTIRGSVHSLTEGRCKPSFLSHQELKQIILQIADGFVFVVGCDRGRILYVSASVTRLLGYSQSDFIGQSWFDILHPKDISKVKEQLSSSDLSPRERLIDSKTFLPVKADVPNENQLIGFCTGARRSFFCRMKCKNVGLPVKEEADTMTGTPRKKRCQGSGDKRFKVIHCTGYLKAWTPSKMEMDEDAEGDSESCNLSCLVAVGRLLPPILNGVKVPPSPPTSEGESIESTDASLPLASNFSFISRHAVDGKFVYVEPSMTLALGYLPQELLGTSMYEFCYPADITHLADAHKTALKQNDSFAVPVYRFRNKEGDYTHLQTTFKRFTNPWTKEVEFLIARHTLKLAPKISLTGKPFVWQMGSCCHFFWSSCSVDSNADSPGTPYQKAFGQETDMGLEGDEKRDMGPELKSQIRQQVMDEALEIPSESGSLLPLPFPTKLPTSGPSTSREKSLARGPSLATILSSNAASKNGESGVKNQTVLVNVAAAAASAAAQTLRPPQFNGTHSDRGAYSRRNDEAAMAVIMSLLEADAGLGGPVDFNGLPWPLP
ncbi:unnamed protein product, partial [Darwinula stevensoni]